MFCWICMCSIIMLLIMIPSATNPNYINNIKDSMPVVLSAGIILAIIGGILQKKAEKISTRDFELSGKEELDGNNNNKSDDVKKVSPLHLVLASILAIVFVFGGFYLLDVFK